MFYVAQYIDQFAAAVAAAFSSATSHFIFQNCHRGVYTDPPDPVDDIIVQAVGSSCSSLHYWTRAEWEISRIILKFTLYITASAEAVVYCTAEISSHKRAKNLIILFWMMLLKCTLVRSGHLKLGCLDSKSLSLQNIFPSWAAKYLCFVRILLHCVEHWRNERIDNLLTRSFEIVE